MTEIDLCAGEESTVEMRVEACAERLGLVLSRMTLRSYPGCTHWHFKRAGVSGTLEATWWPKTGRLWLKIARNRQAEWMQEAIAVFKIEFADS